MRKNNQNKKQNLIIAVLAVLLIGLLTVNTYAFFTDRKTGTQTLQFGKIELDVSDLTAQEGIVTVTNSSEESLKKLMPGSKIEGNFDIAMANGSQSAWLRFKLVASAKATSIATLLGNHTFSDRLASDNQYVTFNGVDYYVTTAKVVTKGANFGTAVTGATAEAVIEYLENLPSGVTYSVNDETAGTVTATFDTETYAGFDQAKAEALSAKYVSIMSQIDTLNEQFDLSDVTDQDGDATTVAWYRGSDGYFYRNGATDSTTELGLEFTYYVPFEFDNDLQELEIEYALEIEAVQYANTTDENATFELAPNDVVTFEIDVNPDPQLGDPVDLSTAEIEDAETDYADYVNVLYSARAFHAAVATHNGIQAK